MTGTISRWGTRGYGFVTCDGAETEAWLHAKFLDDPSYEPRQGDRVEFELEKLDSGRYQARKVRPLNGAAASPGPSNGNGVKPRPSTRPVSESHGYNDGPLSVKLSLPPMVFAESAAHANSNAQNGAAAREESASEAKSEPKAERSESKAEARAEAKSESKPEVKPESKEARVHTAATIASAVVATPADSDEPLGRQLARRKEERNDELERLRAEAADADAEMARLESRRQAIRAAIERCQSGGASEDQGAVAAYLHANAARLEQGFADKRRLRDALETARLHALQRSGLPTVQEYEQLRERLREATLSGDSMMIKAFRALERERRMTLRELADAYDRLEATPPVRARFVAFVSEGEPVVVVAPLLDAPFAGSARAIARSGALGDASLRIACSFWQAAERATRELSRADANVEHGQVAGRLAVRLGNVDAGLVQLLLDETWASRPALARHQIEAAFEVVEGAAPPWQAEPDAEPDEEEAAAPESGGAAPAGYDLPEVAERLRLSLRDLVAMLSDRGLPFSDDAIEAGTEDTLRALLGENTVPAKEAEGEAATADAALDDDDDAVPVGPLGPRGIASRMLKKLLRDRRVGGRHTRIENAYGHHFNDVEKDLARTIAEWLEKDGIFIPKLNEGSHHISINPRRLRDVGQIIDRTWERAAELDAL